ncbi:ATP-dependent endonuclease [Micromonospora sp. NPDC005686]|uniref:ATP-dependent nuclease n=2 Tax=Micromonospora TaxID=1873 RepID=UPI0033F4A641
MQLRKIRIRNFRNFADMTIEPFPTPAVVVGENGVGKSNLLHALRLVLDPDLSDRRRQLQPDDIHDGSAPLAEGTEVSVEVELSDFDTDPDAQSELDGAIVATGPLVARLTYLFRPRKSLGVVLGTAPARKLTPDDYNWTIFGANDPSNAMLSAKRYAALSVLPALRNAEDDLGRADRSPLTRLLRELPPAEDNVDRALAQMQAARDELSRDPNVRAVRRMLRERVKTMAGPQLDLVMSLAFAGRSEDLLRTVRLFVDPFGTRGVERTSTGAANVIYLALLLERLRLRRQAGDGEDTLLAVEEPEAHLHPSLQRHVFAHLLGEPNRLVLTTHSPHIAAVTPISSMVLLAESAGNTRARIVPPGLLTPEQTADLQRYLNVTRAEILFARYVILVEGAAENYLVPALAAAAGFDLDGHGVVVAGVDGTDFAPYAQLLGPNALDRPFVVLTDGDIATSDTAKRDRTKGVIVSAAEPGLWRAQGLLQIQDAEAYEYFADRLQGMAELELPDSGTRLGRDDLVVEASNAGVYVGRHTLEVDIAPLLADEMVTAFNELASGAVRQRNFASAVKDCAGGKPTADDRNALLSRIDRIGKGRYAQRLADHVAELDLRGRVLEVLGVTEDEELARDHLLTLPGCGPLLALLRRVS